ncbi:alpha/beta hydrolase [Nocardia sp. NPDC056000]|uniref:alpha/beta hydrolase n=1 Tax=Nocardia sp. NPDC056000 TaxID=3345674 RepID=UPI0035E31E60
MIWRPPGADYYGWLVGMQWPEGNEDNMWKLADDWKAAATQLDNVKADIDAAISAVRAAYPEGDGGDAMLAQLNALKCGDLSKDGAGSIDSFVKWFESIAGLAENTGTEFEYTKLMFNAMLLIMAVDMAFAAFSLFGAPAAEAAIIAANRVAARVIMKKLLTKLVTQGVKFAEIAELKAVLKRLAIDAAVTGAKSAALGAAMGTVPDAGIQLWQRYNGRRQEFSWEQVGIMAVAGAAGGVAAAGIGSGMRGLFGMPVKMTTRVATTGVTMLAAGGGAGLAGWGASALITGNTELDPRMITAGMWGGAAPGALRSVKPKMHAPTVVDPVKSDPATAKPAGVQQVPALADRAPSTPADTAAGAGPANGAPHAGDSSVSANGRDVAPAAAPAAGSAGEPQIVGNPSGRSDLVGSQLSNGQNGASAPGTHQPPAAQPTAGPKLDTAQPGATQPAAAHPTGEPKTPPEARAPRTEAPAPPPTDRAAGAAPGREVPGQSPHAQAKATGVEATSRAERLDVSSNDRASVPASDRPKGMIGGLEEHQPPNGSGRTHNDDVANGERNPQRDTDTTGDGHTNRDGHTDRHGQPARDDEHDRTGQPDRDGQPAHDGRQDRTGQPAHDGQRSHDPLPSHPEPSSFGDHTPRPVLPVDHPITAAERQHAANALAKLGHDTEPRQLLHADNVDQAGAHQKARENHNWWQDLTPDQQSAVTRLHPHEVGNADGVPPHARDQANRLSIARDLAELRERNPRVEKWTSRFSDPEGRQQFQNLQSTIRNLEHADTLADNFANRDRTDPTDPPGYRPPVHVLSYDSKAFNGEGRAVVAIGDVDHASTVSFHIPGITTTVRSLEVNLNNAFNHFWATSDNVHDPATVAAIAWIGYDAPSGSRIGREMTNPALAQRGGQLLARDVAAFNQTRKINAGLPGGSPPPEVHLFGHSYGSTTTSYAGAGGRLTGEVSTITLLGSPGAGPIVHASEFGIGAENVFVASSSRDPVTWIGSSTPGEIARAAPGLGMGLGMDPSVEAFGARRVIAQFPGGVKTFSDISTHTGYYRFHDEAHSIPSESLHNFAKIAAGDKANIIPEFARPDHESLNAWQRNIGSLPSDPAHLRPPIFDPHEGAPFGYEHLVDEFRHPDPIPDHPTLPADHQPVNDCGPQALRQAQDLTGNENIRIPTDPEIAQRGMSAQDLETAAGGRMQHMETPGVLADHLTRLGEGATAIVISEFHGPTDTNGIGAHAYTVTNDGGRLMVHDSTVPGGPHTWPVSTTNVRNTYAVLYDSHGNPTRPIDSATQPHARPAHPEVRIGQAEPHGRQPGHEQPHTTPQHQPETPATTPDQIRRFDTDDEGRKFGDETMGSHIDSLTETEAQEVSRYRRYAWINEILRDPDPGARFAQLAEDHSRQQQLMRLNGGKSFQPKLELLESYASHPSLDPPLRAALDSVLHDQYPRERLTKLWLNGQEITEIRRNLGTEPTVEVLKQHVQTLDRLTGHLTPEGFEITRGTGIRGLDHLTIDQHGTMLDGKHPRELINTVQTERGYLSTSLGERPPSNFARLDVRFELDVPEGSRGLWIGDSEHEFLMQRGTRYLITDVIEDPPGTKHTGVKYLIKGTVVGRDYVHEPAARGDHPLAPDQDHVPFNLADEQPAPAVEVPNDRPASLTPHLQGRFDQLKSLATEIAKSLNNPARFIELPRLRDDFTRVLDRTGFMHQETYATLWRLLGEHDPAFKDYLGKYGNDLLAMDPEARTPTHTNDSRSQHHPADTVPEISHPAAEPHSFPAKETEAGASFHPDDAVVADLAARIAKDPDHFTADVHITEDGHAHIGDRTYTPEEFANLLRQTNWDGNTPIRLVGCDAASNGFAAHLARYLGVDVLAPTKPAWSDHQGRLYTSTAETHPDGTRRPRIPPDGTWETFHPDGTKTRATEDGFAPGTRAEDKLYLSPEDARDRAENPSDRSERLDDFRELRDENRAKRIEGFEAVQDITHRNPSVDGVRRPMERALTNVRYRPDDNPAPHDFFNYSGVSHDWPPASEAPTRPPKGQRVFETSHANAFDPNTGKLGLGEGSDRANDSEPKVLEDVLRYQLEEHSGLPRDVVEQVLAASIREVDNAARAEYAEVRAAWKDINKLLTEDNRQAARDAERTGTSFTPRTIRDSTVHELVNETGLPWHLVERVIEDSHEVHISNLPDMQPGREFQELRTRARIELAIETLNNRAVAEVPPGGTPHTPFSAETIAGELRMMIDLPSARSSHIPEMFQICDSCMNLIDVYQRMFPNMRVEALNLALERLYPL